MTVEEQRAISLLMTYHPEYSTDWKLCPNLIQKGRYYSFCVFGDNQYWSTSYKKFFMSPQSAENNQRQVAYRNAIQYQIEAFKEKNGGTGEVDHKPPVFKDLVKQFEQELGYTPTPFYDCNLAKWVLSYDVKSLWQKFHEEHANLQLLSPSDHKRITGDRRLAGE